MHEFLEKQTAIIEGRRLTDDNKALMVERIVEMVESRGSQGCIFPELHDEVSGFTGPAGKPAQVLVAEHNPSIIIWQGHSELAGAALEDLLKSGRLRSFFCDEEDYRAHGFTLQYPVLSKEGPFNIKKTHWLPGRLVSETFVSD